MRAALLLSLPLMACATTPTTTTAVTLTTTLSAPRALSADCAAQKLTFAPSPAATLTHEALVTPTSKPQYPRDLAQRGVSGRVELVLEVTAESTLRCVRLERSSGDADLDALALHSAATVLRVQAADVDGTPVDAEIHYAYRFDLFDDDGGSAEPWWKYWLDKKSDKK